MPQLNTFELFPNGTAKIHWTFNNIDESIYWTTSGGQLRYGWPTTDLRFNTRVFPWTLWLDRKLKTSLGTRHRYSQTEIDSVSEDELRLKSKDGQVLTMTRLPE
jgi:hypothetical protein